MVMYHLGLNQAEVDELSDEEFTEAAARAYFIEDRKALAVKRGLLMALEDLAKN